MDEHNNNNHNPYEEQNMNDTPNGNNPYDRPPQDQNPYSPPPSDPYNYNKNAQQGQYMQNADPYNRQDPYHRPDIPQQGSYSQQYQGNYSRPYNGGYGQPYGNQYYPYQQPANQSTGMATASMVCGICSIAFAFFDFSFPPLFLLPIVGLVLGIVFKCKHLPVGKGASTAGIITSIIGLLIPILLIIFVIALLLSHGAEIMQYVKEVSPEQYDELYELYGQQFPEWFGGAIKFFLMK